MVAKATDIMGTRSSRKLLTGKSSLFWLANLTGWAMFSPWLIGFIIFTAVPMVLSFYYCFTIYNVSEPPRWVWLYNFEYLFTDRLFGKAIYNTLYYVALSQPLVIIGSLLLALLLNQPLFGRTVFRTIYYLPSVLSAVAVAMLWLWLLDTRAGLINVALKSIGIRRPPDWLFDSTWTKPALVLMRMWGLGNSAVIFLAGLQGIPEHLHEAAQIDGAGVWQRFWKITLPMLSPTMFFQIVTGLISAFQMFAPVFVWTQIEFGGTMGVASGPQDSLLMYALLLYQTAFRQLYFGRASAMAWLLFAFILALTIAQFRLAQRWVYYESGEGGV